MLELLSEHQAFGGWQRFYRHQSDVIGLPMRFAVYTPPQAQQGKQLPALLYLAGLTCTEETFAVKSGAQRFAAEHGIILITPDTSPRGANVPGETDSWDLGVGAGFYVNATSPAWQQHYRMDSYITDELYSKIIPTLGVDVTRVGIFGHSMGGHGALVLALRNQDKFKSVSAFAPIANPVQCPWGKKAFSTYLGEDTAAWAAYDASLLMQKATTPFAGGILVDQGLADKFLEEQLYPESFEAACKTANQPLTLRRHAGYDHGYYFIATFMEDHIAFHAKNLLG
jgi:S-formylglutathione hydrolase